MKNKYIRFVNTVVGRRIIVTLVGTIFYPYKFTVEILKAIFYVPHRALDRISGSSEHYSLKRAWNLPDLTVEANWKKFYPSGKFPYGKA